jgi:hypothetical protein
MSRHRNTRLSEGDHFERGHVVVFAFLVAIAAAAALMRMVGVIY